MASIVKNMRAKFINEKFKEDGDPIKDMNIGMNLERYVTEKFKEEGIDMSYEEFLIELDDRIANQDAAGVIRDLYTFVSKMQKENKYNECDKIIGDEEFIDFATNMIMKMLQEVSFVNQKKFVDPVIDHLIDMMK